MCFTVSDEVDLVLSLLLLQPMFGASMVTNAAAAQNEDDRPHQPKPPELIVVAAALRLSTAVSGLTDVALVVNTLTVQQTPVCCGLGGGDRAHGVQKQSHLKPQTHASHSSEKWLRQKHEHANAAAARKLCPEYPEVLLGPCRAERPLYAPPPRRSGHFNVGTVLAQLVGATG